MSARLFKSLHSGEQVATVLRPLSYARLVKMLNNQARDATSVVDPGTEIRIRVDEESFAVLNVVNVEVDFDLLEEAVTILLDNAVKYRFASTPVRTSGGLSGTGRFQISVLNKGLPIHPHEISKCVERGWRGDRARLTTGEGSGIGLWLVDNIMRAHKGDLIIVATTPGGMTEVKQAFPAKGQMSSSSKAGQALLIYA
ncbi:MAG: ATP-binding protein [Terriglobales bacterium]